MSNVFKNKKLQDTYDALMTNPTRMQLDSEQAIMRLMLAQVLERLDADRGIPMDMIAAVTTMCEKITGVTEKIAKLNEVTPETINRLLDGVADILVKYVPQEHIEAATNEVGALTNIGKQCNIPYDNGDKVLDHTIQTTSNPDETNGAVSVHKIALVELAKTMEKEEEFL
jgi:hypothetical protein